MTEKMKVLFELLKYYQSLYSDKKIRIVIFKNENSTYDIYTGISLESIVKESLNKDDKLIIPDTLTTIKNINLIELNYILFIINMKYVIVDSNKDKNIITLASNKISNNSIELIFNKDILGENLLNEHLIGIRRNSYKYGAKDENNTRIKDKIRSAKENISRTYEEYYNMLSYFISRMNYKPVELAYSYSYNEYLELLKEDNIKDLLDVNFGNTNFKKYSKKLTIDE